MKLLIKYKKNNSLPDIADLLRIMWKEDISVSKAADAVSFKDCTTLSLAWDKWLNDKRWASHPKFKEYIYFDIIRKDPVFSNKMILEIDNNAIEVDKRAFHKAVVYIAEKTHGEISVDGAVWLDPKDYAETVKEYLKLSFEEAVELSLSN
jgi:hypothetical protein